MKRVLSVTTGGEVNGITRTVAWIMAAAFLTARIWMTKGRAPDLMAEATAAAEAGAGGG